MKMRISRNLSPSLFLVILLFIPAVFGQQTEQQNVAALKKAVQESMAGLRKYEWVETTTVLLKGEVKSQKHNRCYYGVDGKIQKIAIDDAAPPQESGGRRGRIKARVVAKKKEELTDYMQKAVALVHKYVPPDPVLIKYSADASKLAVEPFEPGRIIRVSFHDFVKPRDLLAATFNIQANQIVELNVNTWLESEQDGITLVVAFSQLPDGTTYSGTTTLVAKTKDIKVVIENTGHRVL